ncbi:aldehyde dehydrogenase [Paraburkholderia sediminicola]|nr:aldehyde dehydrogenase [Paraburkholderia sediminicola]
MIDPSTEATHDGFILGGVEDVELAIAAARDSFDSGPWPSMAPDERGRLIARMTQYLSERRGELEEAWTLQVGALATMRGRAVDNGIGHFRRAAEQARNLQIERRAESPVGDAIIRQEPVGVVAAIAAWNGTLLQASSKIGPALAAGCTVVLKPAPSTPIEAIIIAECAEAAGIPPGVLNVIHVSNMGAERLISDPRVDKVSFTGSTGIGRHIARTCGERIARYSLELGGKSAAIVLDDADIQVVGKTLGRTITALSGQLCSMLSRVVVTRDRHDALAEAIAAEMAKVKVGSAYDPSSEMGPMALERQRLDVEEKIVKAQAEGATLAFGGKRPVHLSKGFFLEPTLFSNVSPDASLAQAEVFGPVLALIPAKNEEDAVRIANNSIYGLHGSVFTRDKDRALAIARRIRTGTFAQNGMRLDFALPFGGYKQSGVGREGGPEAIAEYLETKTIILDASHQS